MLGASSVWLIFIFLILLSTSIIASPVSSIIPTVIRFIRLVPDGRHLRLILRVES